MQADTVLGGRSVVTGRRKMKGVMDKPIILNVSMKQLKIYQIVHFEYVQFIMCP